MKKQRFCIKKEDYSYRWLTLDDSPPHVLHKVTGLGTRFMVWDLKDFKFVRIFKTRNEAFEWVRKNKRRWITN